MFVFNTMRNMLKPGMYHANCLFRKYAQSPSSLLATHQLADPRISNPKRHQNPISKNKSLPSKGHNLVGKGNRLLSW